MKFTAKCSLAALVLAGSVWAAECAKIIITKPEFSEKTLGKEYRGKNIAYASDAVAKAFAAKTPGAVIMTLPEYQVLSASCQPEEVIQLSVSSFKLEPPFKNARYAVLKIEELRYKAPDFNKPVLTKYHEVTGPKWFGVNMPLKWVIRYFGKEMAKPDTAAVQ